MACKHAGQDRFTRGDAGPAFCPADYVLPEDGINMNKTGHVVFAQKMFECMREKLHEMQ